MSEASEPTGADPVFPPASGSRYCSTGELDWQPSGSRDGALALVIYLPTGPEGP